MKLPVHRFSAFHETRRIITAFITSRYFSADSARLVESTTFHCFKDSFQYCPHIYIHVFQLVSFLWEFLTNFFILFSSPPYVLHAPPTSPSLLCSTLHTVSAVNITKVLNVLFSPVTCYFFPLSPKYLLGTLFSNTPSFRSSLNTADQVSHPYKPPLFPYTLLTDRCFSQNHTLVCRICIPCDQLLRAL